MSDYNQNSAWLNSVLQKLGKLDVELAGLLELFNDCKSSSTDTQNKKDEMQIAINNEVDLIRKELYTKLNNMLDSLREHQTSQQAEALRLQQEISTLKKEKLDLYQKVNELQRRIGDMEMTIGQDPSMFR